LNYDSTRKICTFYNKRVISKKLVTIFARHLDSFTVTQSLSSFTSFVKPALDSSFNRDSLIVRRDWQKLRHGGLPTGTVFWLKYRDSYRRTVPPTLSAHTRWPLAFMRRAAIFGDNLLIT
jgi:hypothetical protein